MISITAHLCMFSRGQLFGVYCTPSGIRSRCSEADATCLGGGPQLSGSGCFYKLGVLSRGRFAAGL